MTESRLIRGFYTVCRNRGHHVCVRSTEAGRSMTFAEVEAAALAVAGRLERYGRGQRVALLVPPSGVWVSAFWGSVLSGNLVVPLVEIHPAKEHARALRAAKVDRVIVARELRPLVEAALECEPAEWAGPGRKPPEVLELESLFEPRTVPQTTALAGNEPCVLYFTSGTSGEPKAALVSHDQLASLAELVGRAWAVSAEDCLLHCLPLHHTHGLGIAFLVCFLAGSEQLFLRRFSPEAVWQGFEHSSLLMAVPTMHKRLLDAYDLAPPDTRQRWLSAARRQRLITSGSAALPLALAQRWQSITGEIPLERFGMTEVGVALSNPLAGRRPTSVGQVLPGMQVRIVDDLGHDVLPGTTGEIWIRGPSVFLGYDADPEATARAFTDGWFKSGDSALWLDDGFVKIMGRTSIDILKSGGYKLSALEIEDVLGRHPSVDEVAVVGVPSAEWGDEVVAVVVSQTQVDPEELRCYLKSELAPYKVPRRVVQVSELPRNALGKVTKHLLSAQLKERV